MSLAEPKALVSDTLERIVPSRVSTEDYLAQQSLDLHLARYSFASKHLKHGVVLDIACGVGYGSSLLRSVDSKVEKIHAVDCSAEAIEYANSVYSASGIEFIQADAFAYLGENSSIYSTIISLETIEHLEKPEEFVKMVRAALLDEGKFICSVPISPTIDINPHHLSDFTRKSFYKMLESAGFVVVEEFQQKQKVSLASLMQQNSYRAQGDSRSLLKFYLGNPDSLYRRIKSCCRDGFSTRYMTVVARKAS